MILRILVCSLFASSAVNALADNMHIYRDKSGQVLVTNSTPSGNSSKFNNNVRRVYYSDASKDTYINVDDNIQRATKVVQQSKPTTTNNVVKFYIPVELSQSDKKSFEYLKSTEKVEVIQNNDPNKVYDSMMANGYSLLGSSVFIDRNLPNSIFISQAKKLGASKVAIYKENTSTVHYDINDDLNNLDYAYQYASEFYVKDNFYKNPNMMGINMEEIPLDKRNKFQRNTGAYIVNVIKGSKAYFANIVLEDVVIAVNGKEVRVVEDLNTLKEAELKITKNLNLTIIRLINNEPKEIQIPMSFN